MKYKREVLYIVVCLISGILIAAVLTEVAYRFQTHSENRDGKQITLVIPLGTADKVKSGEPSPSIPADMVLVVGDELRVVNEDVEDHQLGTLFIPKGTSASITFSRSENLAYACTFTPEKYFGLEIKEPLTISTRLIGILSAGIPLGILMALYLVFAIRPGLKMNSLARNE